MVPSKYTFSDYSADWPREFEREAQRLKSLLGGELRAVHHIGSTSVPGLSAKPIVDLLPVAGDIGRIDEQTSRLEQAGYKAWGEYGIAGRRFFTKDRGGYRTHNIHVFEEGDAQIERHLAFCAYLRADDPMRDQYAALKRDVYARHPDDIAAYSAGKDAWIKRVEPLAVAWFRTPRSAVDGPR